MGMNRAPDRLSRLVAVVLCVRVTARSRRTMLRPRRFQHVEFEVAQGPKGLQATHVRAV